MSLVIDQNTNEPQPLEQYSFSKLSSWWTCPYGYRLRYIEHKAGIGNAFSSFGTLVHSLMERYARGEIEIWDLSTIYEWEFDSAVPYKFPWNKYVDLKKTYYSQGLEYLKSFSGYDDYKILGIEEEFKIPMNDWIFVGIIDLVFEDENGRLIIRDYKSKSSFKNSQEQAKYARQLYLYSAYVREKYGKFPDALQFSMFRKKEIIEIEFNLDDYKEALQWADDTVSSIKSAFDFPPNCEDFYANNLCNHREYCEFKPKKSNRKKHK